jgi:uncharacterized membrane protein
MSQQSSFSSIQPSQIYTSKRIIKSLKAKADARRKPSEVIADWMTKSLGSIWFLSLNVLWFTTWILININAIPGIPAFDPFPFGLLTMIVSLEAIMLAIFVLISQNRASQIDDLREEIDLQVDIITEKELTKLIHMMSILMEKNGIDLSGDKEIQGMIKPTNLDRIQKILEKQVLDTNK